MPETPLTPEQRARDEQVRRNIELAFGFGGLDEDEEDAVTPAPGGADENARRRAEEEQVARDLQRAGLF